MALITTYLRLQSLLLFHFSMFFFYSSYVDSSYLTKDVSQTEWNLIHKTEFGRVLIRGLAAALLMAATMTGYAATFSAANNKKKVVRGLFMYNAFMAYQYISQWLEKNNHGKHFDLAKADHYELGKVAGFAALAGLSFVFSLVSCGASRTQPVLSTKKTQ